MLLSKQSYRGGGADGGEEEAEAPRPEPRAELLDDIFGPSDDEAQLSDLRRLQARHHTAGYRDGYVEAKATSIQPGFDEGFSLGATIGLHAGQLLGVLEGIAEALRGGGGPAEEAAAAQASRSLDQARKELSTDSIFSPHYWAPDGTWSFEVDGTCDGRLDKEGAEGPESAEVVFADVAEAHPLIRKWHGLVRDQMKRWGMTKWDVLEGGNRTPSSTSGGGSGSGENYERVAEDDGPDPPVAGKAAGSGEPLGRKAGGALEW